MQKQKHHNPAQTLVPSDTDFFAAAVLEALALIADRHGHLPGASDEDLSFVDDLIYGGFSGAFLDTASRDRLCSIWRKVKVKID